MVRPSLSSARAVPAVTARPRLTERTARPRVRPIKLLASILCIALSRPKIALSSKPLGQGGACKSSTLHGYYLPDQGAFAAGIPQKESYNSAATPATIATSAKLNTYQLKV